MLSAEPSAPGPIARRSPSFDPPTQADFCAQAPRRAGDFRFGSPPPHPPKADRSLCNRTDTARTLDVHEVTCPDCRATYRFQQELEVAS